MDLSGADGNALQTAQYEKWGTRAGGAASSGHLAPITTGISRLLACGQPPLVEFIPQQ
jgi:hypothetical protein